MKCKYCGNETNPRTGNFTRLYRYTSAYCSNRCKATYMEMQAKAAIARGKLAETKTGRNYLKSIKR